MKIIRFQILVVVWLYYILFREVVFRQQIGFKLSTCLEKCLLDIFNRYFEVLFEVFNYYYCRIVEEKDMNYI